MWQGGEAFRPSPFLAGSAAGDLLEHLDTDADHGNSTENRQDDGKHGPDGVHDVGSHRREAGRKRGSNGTFSSLTLFLPSINFRYALRIVRSTNRTTVLMPATIRATVPPATTPTTTQVRNSLLTKSIILATP